MLNFDGIKGIIDWWVELNWKFRILVPICLLFLSTILLFFRILWIWGWVVGGILLLFSGKSKSEENGYRF